MSPMHERSQPVNVKQSESNNESSSSNVRNWYHSQGDRWKKKTSNNINNEATKIRLFSGNFLFCEDSVTFEYAKTTTLEFVIKDYFEEF